MSTLSSPKLQPNTCSKGLRLKFIPRYFDKSTEVAFHPTLRFHVRTLYFDRDILDENFAEYETWEATIDTRELATTGDTRAKNPEEARWQCSQADLDRSHTNFCRLLASQRALFDGRMDLIVLSAALPMLQNLRTIESIEKAFRNGAVATPYDFIAGHEKDWVPILSDLQTETLLPTPFIDLSQSTQPETARPLAPLISGLGLARRQLRTKELRRIPWSFWKQEGPSGFEHGVRSHIHAASRYLESLDIQFVVDVYDLEVSLQGLMPPSANNLFGAAPGLRLLDLTFLCYEEDDDGAGFGDANWGTLPRTGQVLATVNLPNLVIFRLWSCILTEETLIDFIRRHSTTLKEISMSFVRLDNRSFESTSWEETLKQIAPILFLDWVKLRWLWSDDIEDVVGAGDPNDEAFSSRHAAYCQSLADFLWNREAGRNVLGSSTS